MELKPAASFYVHTAEKGNGLVDLIVYLAAPFIKSRNPITDVFANSRTPEVIALPQQGIITKVDVLKDTANVFVKQRQT